MSSCIFYMKIEDIFVKPVLTEKATNLANNQVYTFEVRDGADKAKVKDALEKLYKVKVSQVRMMIRKGKKRKVGKKMVVKKLTDRKIALVKLREGKIDLFPQT